MRTTLLALLVLSGACTTPSTPDDDLYGTWERRDASGHVIEAMTFSRNGRFTATATTNPERPSNLWDLRSVRGHFEADDEVVLLSGQTTDGTRFDIELTYYADDVHLVRGAFLLNDDENPHSPLVRDFHAVHARSFDELHHRSLRAGFNLVETGDGVGNSYGASFLNPIFESPDGDGGSWQMAADGGAIILDNGDRYEVFGAGHMTALGRFDTRLATIDAPANLRDTAYIFTRSE